MEPSFGCDMWARRVYSSPGSPKPGQYLIIVKIVIVVVLIILLVVVI